MQSFPPSVFPQGPSVISKCVADLKPVPQAAAPGQVSSSLLGTGRACFSVPPVQGPGVAILKSALCR